MLSQAKMPPPLKKYRGKRGDVYLPDFFFLFSWGRWGVCTQPRQKFLCKKKGKFTQSRLTTSSRARSLEQKPFLQRLVQERE